MKEGLITNNNNKLINCLYIVCLLPSFISLYLFKQSAQMHTDPCQINTTCISVCFKSMYVCLKAV